MTDETPDLLPCDMEGCDKPAHARGWCKMHHMRWLRHSKPEGRTFMKKSFYKPRIAKLRRKSDYNDNSV